MPQNELLALIITAVIGLIFVVIGVLFLFKKGSFLIAGYNMMSKSEKEKVNIDAVMKFIGKIIIIIGLTTPLVSVAGIYNKLFLFWIYVGGVLGLAVFMIVYVNTNDKFKNK